MKTFFTFLSTLLFIVSTDLTGIAQIIHVPGDQPTIQDGINLASDGDTVLVADGTYFENISFMGKPITVASHFLIDGNASHISATTIDGSLPDEPDNGSVVTFSQGEDTTSHLCGFTLTHGTGTELTSYDLRAGGGIYCYNSTPKITDNIILNNSVSHPSVTWGGGIGIVRETGSPWVILRNNTIMQNSATAENEASGGGGVAINGNALVENNTVKNNQCTCSYGMVIGAGITHSPSANDYDTLLLKQNTILSNQGEGFALARGGGIYSSYSTCLLYDNIINLNSLIANSDAYGGGLDIVGAGNIEIHDNTVNGNSLTADACYGAGISIGEYNTLDFSGNMVNSNEVFTTNNYWLGAGMLVFEPVSSTSITANEFSFNTGASSPVGAGGGLCLLEIYETQMNLKGNLFRENNAYNGGAVFARNSYHVNCSNNIFNGNTAYRAGGMNLYHPVSSAGNISWDPDVSHPRIFNNTFVGNTASSNGGALRYQGEMNPPEIINNIFWDNASPMGRDIQIESSSPVTVSYCNLTTSLISGPWTGEANIEGNPLFVENDPLCHLQPMSPCRDTGLLSFYAPNTDYNGEDRPDPVFEKIDIGADEFFDVPLAPVADHPFEIGDDYFVAVWYPSVWAMGYNLDVAEDEIFENMVPGFDNYDAGEDTSILVEGLEPGNMYYYRVRGYNGSGISPNSNVIDVASVGNTENVFDNAETMPLLFPNPASDRMNVQYTIDKSENMVVGVYNLAGEEVLHIAEYGNTPGKHSVSINTSGLAAGVYMLRIEIGMAIFPKKLVIMK